MNETKRTRRHFDGQQITEILKRHLLKGESVSDICDDLGIQPSQFYKWQRDFFEAGAENIGKRSKQKKQTREKRLEKENENLKTKISKKDEVISELMEEYIKAKKNIGEL